MRAMNRTIRLAAAGASAVLAAGLVACGGGDGGGEGETALTVSVGRQPYAAGNSPVTQYMIENELFEKAAEKYGYALEVDWRDYPTAAPQVEAMIADRLDIGMWGNTPIVRSISQGQPISVIGVGEGHMRFLLLTRDGSEVTDISDLEGAKIGVTIGADPHMALLQMLEAELGTSDVEELGIELVNIPTQASAAQVPDGVDATVTINPAYLAERADNDQIVPVANSFGATESGYSGELGEGEGHEYPSAEESVFAPEGFYSHRSFWVARDAVIEENPDVISAFAEAQQEAISALQEMDGEEVASLVTEYWGEDTEAGAKVVADELLFQRGWAWATNGDGHVLQKISTRLADAGVIDEALTWEQTAGAFEASSEIAGQAYEAAGSTPEEPAFEDTSADDARGAPQWQLDEWVAPE